MILCSNNASSSSKQRHISRAPKKREKKDPELVVVAHKKRIFLNPFRVGIARGRTVQAIVALGLLACVEG